MKQFTLGLILSSLYAASAIAETQWVDDEVFLPVRNGQGNQYKILHRGLRSGTALEIIEKPNNEWHKIRTPGGTEGWVAVQYLSKTPTANIQLAEAKKELSALKIQN